MDKKLTSIVAYAGILSSFLGILDGIGKLCIFIPLIIWIIAYSAGDKNGAKLHLNQSLVLIILGISCSIVCLVIGLIPISLVVVVTDILDIVVKLITLVFGIIGMWSAIKGEERKLPYIGDIVIIK